LHKYLYDYCTYRVVTTVCCQIIKQAQSYGFGLSKIIVSLLDNMEIELKKFPA
jgi:hypothetical protein